MISKQFPTPYDVEQTLKFHTTSYDDLRKFMQSRGLFNVGWSREHIADFASNILWEHNDYILMRNLSQGADAATNISGFTVRARLLPITIDELKDDITNLRTQLIKQQEELNKRGIPVQKLASPLIDNGVLKMRFEYERMIPGRVELMHRVDSKVNFVVEPISPIEVRIVCYPEADQDVKRIEKLFQNLDRGKYEPFTISLESFSRKQRIQFFDDILEHYNIHPEWRLEQVTEITIKQSLPEQTYIVLDDDNIESSDLAGSEEDILQEASEDDLLSITQAILHGSNLRTNSFVKRCESQGYYYPSMTLLLYNMKTSENIQITIRFKLSPRMFEVILSGTTIRTETGESPTAFDFRRQQEILKEFWNTSHEVWKRIYEQIPKVQAEQMTITDAILVAHETQASI